MLLNGDLLDKVEREWTETIDFSSHKITAIKVKHSSKNGELYGLVFFNGDNQIATIGLNTTNKYATTMMIELQEGEIWCGVSSSLINGSMYHF